MCSSDQLREYLINEFKYSMEDIPLSLGGLTDPTIDGDTRYQHCLATVTNPQSICSSYYSVDCQPVTSKSSSNILFFNADHHHHNQHSNQDTTVATPSLVAIVALRRNPDGSQSRIRKRESSSSTDSEKRRRSNGSPIEEEEQVTSPFLNDLLNYIPQEISLE